MKSLQIIFLLSFLIFSCKKPPSKSTVIKSAPPSTAYKPKLSDQVVSLSLEFLKTPYAYGGTNKSGVDCSGLVFAVFTELGKKIPRSSYQQAEFFKEIEKDELKTGDIIYFKVNSKNIDHTGIVVELKAEKEIMFIHASSSQGVRIDNLYAKYWLPKFVKACRPS